MNVYGGNHRNMATSKNHHFVPQFYLRQWCGDDGNLIAWWRVPGGLDSRQLAPAAVGYKPHLYSYSKDTVGRLRDEIEKVHFQRVDGEAPRVFQKILANKNLTETDVEVWAEFILNMRVRTPENVEYMKNFWKRTLRDLEVRRATLENEEKSFYQWVKTKEDSFPEDIALSQLPAIGGNERAMRDIKLFVWRTAAFEKSKRPLVCSDRPLIVTSGLHKEDCIVVLPVSPRLAFIAFRPGSNAERHLMSLNENELIKAINNAVVRAADKFVFTRLRSDISEAFLNERMRSN